MQQFDILDPKLNVFQSRFLEASAGTGKTFAIEHLVCRLLLESDPPISVQEILAVTFTKEAAHEMKTRIRTKLEGLSDRRAREALANFDEIQVFTIHGFCHRMLSEFAFEARTPLQMASPDQPDHLTEMRQTVEDFFRTADPAFAPEVEDLVKRSRFDLDRLVARIVGDMEKGETAAAKECHNRWKVKAARHDHFTFDDLIRKMDAALTIPAFLEKVRAKYKAVIVDEFQDTDSFQWKIFERLFLENHLLYLVGDPKQSIYGFRSADIYTYMQAAKSLGEEKKAYLDTNFRSSPKLIEALNSLFTQKPDWIGLPSLPGALQYHPVKAGRLEGKLDESPLIYFGVESKPGRERSWPTKTMEQEKLFPYIAQEVIRLKEKIGFEEIAILVKDRFQAQRLQLHFNQWKIPTAIKRTLNLAESRGFFAMEMLLKATAQPEKESIVRAALQGPLMEKEGNPFFTLKQLFLEKGFSAFFSELPPTDPTLYLELRQTGEILMQAHQASLEELLHLMGEFKASDPERDPRLKLQGEEGEGKVQIMTIFASKGLEFDVVFALGMAARHYAEETDEEKEAEKMRQLYVAFTRAREKLYIPRLFDLFKKPQASPIELFFEGIDVPIQWVENIHFQPYREEKKRAPLIQPPTYNPQFEPEYLTSFSSMAKPHISTLLSEKFRAQDLTVKTPHTLPLGAETGTVIHSVFETHFQDRAIPLEQVTLEVLSGTHLEGWEEVIAQMVKDILKMPLQKEFSLDTLKEGDYFQEMEFLFPQKNQLIKGFADLVFKSSDTFYILDWKTNWLGDSNYAYTEDNIHQAMKEHDYYLQARLYGEAIKRYVKRLYINPQFGGAYYVFVRGKKVAHIEATI